MRLVRIFSVTILSRLALVCGVERTLERSGELLWTGRFPLPLNPLYIVHNNLQ